MEGTNRSQKHRLDVDSVLDARDYIILEQLQDNARMSAADLAKLVGLSPSGVQKRLRRLEEDGVIQHYSVQLDRRKLGFDVVAYVHVTLRGHSPESVAQFDSSVAAMPEVLESHRVTGQADYLLKVLVSNHSDLDHFLIHRLLRLPSVERLNSNLVLKDCKETFRVPLQRKNLEEAMPAELPPEANGIQ